MSVFGINSENGLALLYRLLDIYSGIDVWFFCCVREKREQEGGIQAFIQGMGRLLRRLLKRRQLGRDIGSLRKLRDQSQRFYRDLTEAELKGGAE